MISGFLLPIHGQFVVPSPTWSRASTLALKDAVMRCAVAILAALFDLIVPGGRERPNALHGGVRLRTGRHQPSGSVRPAECGTPSADCTHQQPIAQASGRIRPLHDPGHRTRQCAGACQQLYNLAEDATFVLQDRSEPTWRSPVIVHKVSNLILNMIIFVRDVKAETNVAIAQADMRGDTDEILGAHGRLAGAQSPARPGSRNAALTLPLTRGRLRNDYE